MKYNATFDLEKMNDAIGTSLKELVAIPQWCVHKDKNPLNAKTMKGWSNKDGSYQKAVSTNTWNTFEEAFNGWKASSGWLDGIGFQFGGGYAGIDLDDCVIDGKASDLVTQFIERFDSYTEISPSGKGIHIIVKSDLPDFKGFKMMIPGTEQKIEIYPSRRYFRMSFNVYDEYYNVPPQNRSEELKKLIDELKVEIASPDDVQKPASSKDLPSEAYQNTDDEALEILFREDKARDIYNGEWERHSGTFSSKDDGSKSSADYYLLLRLQYACNGDEAQIERLFKSSALWDDSTRKKHGAEYISRCIKKLPAFDYRMKNTASNNEPYFNWDDIFEGTAPAQIDNADAQKQAEPSSPEADAQDGWKPRAKLLSDFDDYKPEYLWYPYIPLREYFVLFGDSGTSKTMSLCWACARITRGEALPGDDSEAEREPQNVLIISAEDNGGILKSRIAECGGDISRVPCITFSEDGENVFKDFTIKDNYKEYIKEIKFWKAKLVIIDPIQNFIGSTVDTRRVEQLRPALTNLVNIARACDCAIGIIMHVNKSTQFTNLNNRASGSGDFINASRSAMTTYKEGNTVHLVHTKANYSEFGKTCTFEWEKGGKFSFRGFSELTRADIEKASASGGKKKAEDVLNDRYTQEEAIPQIADDFISRCINKGKGQILTISYTQLAEEYPKIFNTTRKKPIIEEIGKITRKQNVYINYVDSVRYNKKISGGITLLYKSPTVTFDASDYTTQSPVILEDIITQKDWFE